MDAVAGGFRRTGHCNIPLQGKSAYRADVGRWYLAGVPSNKKKGQSSITCLLKRMRPTTHARRRAALYRHNATLAAVKKKTEVCV